MESKIKIESVLFFKRTNPPVFVISAVIMLVFILAVTLFTKASKTFFDSIQLIIIEKFSWTFYSFYRFIPSFSFVPPFKPLWKYSSGHCQ